MYMDGGFGGNQIELTTFARFGGIEAVEAAIVRAIVRGEQSVDTLKETTIRIGAREISSGLGDATSAFLEIGAADLAEGILNLKDDAAAIRDWASFILLTSEMFSFADCRREYCDRLLAAIWDLAFGAPVKDATIRLARLVRARSAKF